MLKRALNDFNERDLDAFFANFHPDVVYRDRADEPDASTYHGLGEFKGVPRRWLDSFEDLRFEPTEWIDLDDQVIVVTEMHGHGSATGVAVRGSYVFLWTLRDGLIVDGREYATREEALAAADRARDEASA